MAVSAKFKVVVESNNMNAVVEEVSKQYKVQVPWGGAVMKMLCNNEYKFWRRRWGADAAGSVLLGSPVMCTKRVPSQLN